MERELVRHRDRREASVSTSLPALRAAYDRCVGFADATRDARMDEHLSDFWREILEGRANYPSFNEMQVMRRGFTYPIADRGKAEDLMAESAYARSAWDVIGRTVPVAYFDRFEESAVGAPTAFDFEGHVLSAGGIVNALTSYRIVEACARLGLEGRPLRMLEIGAGYGQVAHQLLQQLDVETYAVCDLPENAFLTAYYLQVNHPDRQALFAGADESMGGTPGLAFAIPPHLHRLEGTYDVIVNSYSFQEMTLDSVRDYIGFAAERLNPDGFLYSLNAHAKAGVRLPSDYGIEAFELEALACPRRFPWQPNGTVPYELVMRRRAAPALAAERLARRRAQLDGLGGAMQVGLSVELEPLLAAFTDGDEGAPDDALDALAGAFAGTIDERRAAALRVPGAVGAHVAGVLAFVAGDDASAAEALTAALEGLADSHARVWALTVLASLDAAGGEHRRSTARAVQAAGLAPHLASSLAALVGAPDRARAMLASLAGCAPPAQVAAAPAARWRRIAGAAVARAQRPDPTPPTE
jgi:putative sugar O-methyltransferase